MQAQYHQLRILTVATAAGAMLLAGGTGSVASPAHGQTFAVAAASGQKAKCEPSATVWCPSQGSLAHDSVALVQAGDTAGVRTAFDMPRLKDLFSNQAAMTQFDRAFEQKLDVLHLKLPSRKRRAKHLAAPAQQMVGNQLNISDSVKNGRSFQVRTFRAIVNVDGCPHPGGRANPDYLNGAGSFHVQGGASYTVSSGVKRGSRLILSRVQFKVELFDNSRYPYLLGFTNGKAQWTNYLETGGTKEFDLLIEVTRNDTIVNLKSGQKQSLPELDLSLVLTHPFTDIMSVEAKSNSFDAFVARNLADDDQEGDSQATRPLIGSGVEKLGMAFASMVAARVNPAIRAAEASWQKPGQCVTVTLTGPAALAAGASTNVGATVTNVLGSPESDILGSEATYGHQIEWYGDLDPPKGQLETLAKYPVQPGDPWFKYTAPSSPWTMNQHPGFHIRFTSTSGVADAKISFANLLRILISGTIAWTQSIPTTYSGRTESGGDTSTGSFDIKMVSTTYPPMGQEWTSRGSAFQAQDTLDDTWTDGNGCRGTDKGHLSLSGSLKDPPENFPRHIVVADWGPPYSSWVGFNITLDGTESVTNSISGPPKCGPGSYTSKTYVSFDPTCFNQLGGTAPGHLNGRFKGNADSGKGSISVKCSGTTSNGITYGAHGNLMVSPAPG